MLQVLSLQSDRVWNGLYKINPTEWAWVNGERARVPVVLLWIVDRPDDAGGNCGEIAAWDSWAYGTNDTPCSLNRIALCEKRYNL